MTNTKLLEIQLIQKCVSKKKLAKVLGITEMALFNKMKNISEFKASEIEKTSVLLKLSRNERDAIFFNYNNDLKS